MLPLSILTFSFKRFFSKIKVLVEVFVFYYITEQIKPWVQHHFREGDGTPLQDSCLENPMDWGAWWAAVHGVSKSRTQLSDFTFTFHFHASEKEMAWRIPRMAKPGGLPSMGSHRVGHDWSNLAAAAAPFGQVQMNETYSLSWCDLKGTSLQLEFTTLNEVKSEEKDTTRYHLRVESTI